MKLIRFILAALFLTLCSVPEAGVVIGVAGNVDDPSVPVAKRYTVKSDIRQSIQRAGAVVLHMTPDRSIDYWLERVDAVVLTGGGDLDPSLYGEKPHSNNTQIPKERESFDLKLAKAAIERQVPILGICLGQQEIWVILGGSMIQDIPTEVSNNVGHYGKHMVNIIPGTMLQHIYGVHNMQVISNHHQAVDGKKRVPNGLVVSATSPDGLAEAFEGRKPFGFVIGVGWHPERQDEQKLFRFLVDFAEAQKH